jgi:enoyl-CoA hydratase/carnithine racemase
VYRTIRYDRTEHVGLLALARPDTRNAVNPVMRDELSDLGEMLARDETLRCLVVRGDGSSFCAGLDLREGLRDLFADVAASGGEQDERGEGLIEKGLAMACAFEWLPRLGCPSVAAVHGHAYGAGCQLALACDFRIFAEGTRTGLVEPRYGLLPDMGATFRLPRIVGEPTARRMILLGDVIDAAEAVGIGLADMVVPEADLPRAAQEFAARLAAQPLAAVRGARRALDAARLLPDDHALRMAVEQQVACLRSTEFRGALRGLR